MGVFETMLKVCEDNPTYPTMNMCQSLTTGCVIKIILRGL